MILSPEATKPGNVSDGNIDAWKQSLKAIETDGYTIVIPGHGKPGGVELIDHTREVLEKNSKQRR